MLITPLIRKITTITLALDTPSIHTAAATLLRIFAPYTHPDNPNQPALAAPDTLTLLTTLLGPSNPGPCRAAAAAAVAEVAAQGDDHRVALVGLGALELLAQGVAGGGDMVVKGACAGALGQLAHMEQYKVWWVGVHAVGKHITLCCQYIHATYCCQYIHTTHVINTSSSPWTPPPSPHKQNIAGVYSSNRVHHARPHSHAPHTRSTTCTSTSSRGVTSIGHA